MIFAGGSTSWRRLPRSGAFTLVEMIVVVGIILVLTAIVLPAVTRMWEDRKLADADNTIRGALRIARRTAMSTGSGDAGLLFTLDAHGVQRIYPIEQQADPSLPADVRDLVCQKRFIITPGREYALLEPIRAVPRYAVVKEVAGQNEFYAFDAFELASNDLLPTLTGGWQEAQRQRNHFTMVFSSDGRLSIGRDVLIYDEDLDNMANGDGFGDRTGLPLPPVATPLTTVTQYYPVQSTAGDVKNPIDPTGAGFGLVGLVVDANAIAINFPSVSGLLIYDDSLLKGMGAPTESVDEKREFLLRTAQPLYVAGVTATVIRGPLGESEVPGE